MFQVEFDIAIQEIPEYEQAKRYRFRPAMSRRGKKLAELLGITTKEH